MISMTVSDDEFKSMPENEVLRQVRIIKAMRDKGIPIVGHIAIERPERGTLTMRYDDVFGETTYSWQE